jgi:FixJ family two-component response regulator
MRINSREATFVHATKLSATAPPLSRVSQSRPVVFVVDDDVSVRESLRPLIAVEGWQPEVFASAQEFLAHPRVAAPNCLVLDTGLPDADGLDVQLRVADRDEMPVIFIAAYADVPMTVRAMKAGALEFFTKPIAAVTLLSAIRHALARSQALLNRQLEITSLRSRYAALTRRECDVMERVIGGSLNKQVGAKLGITEVTVKAHRAQVMRKMQAGSLVELANMAAKLGIAPA